MMDQRVLSTAVFAAAAFAAALSGCADDDSIDNGNANANSNANNNTAPDPVSGLALDQVLDIGGQQRTYDMFVPENPEGAPIVLLLHEGAGATSATVLGRSGEPAPYSLWLDVASANDLIIIAPNAFVGADGSQAWNDCRIGAMVNSEEDDVAFLGALIDLMVETYAADADRVYAHGSSNGGHMAIRMAEETNRLAAFAAISAANPANSECESRVNRVSALFMNGTDDNILPYSGGPIAGGNNGEVVSVVASAEYWARRIGGDLIVDRTEEFPDLNSADGGVVTRFAYDGNANAPSTEVVLYEIGGGGHSDPTISQRQLNRQQFFLPQNGDIEMVDEVWRFFEGKARSFAAGGGTRFCEVLLVNPNSDGTGVQAEVWATIGTNFCADEVWTVLDPALIAETFGALQTILNGPRLWLPFTPSPILDDTEVRRFGGLEAYRSGTLQIATSTGTGDGSVPYTESMVARSSTYHYPADAEVYEIVTDQGTTYIMQSMSQIDFPNQALSGLPTLGERLVGLPAGWSYVARTLDEDLVVVADGQAVVILDEFGNVYQRN